MLHKNQLTVIYNNNRLEVFELIDFFSWVVFLSTLGTIAFAWGLFLSNTVQRTPKQEEYEKFEERILELMGQFRHMSSTRLQMLDKKIEELRKLIKEANTLYASLCTQETKIAERFSQSVEATELSVVEKSENTQIQVDNNNDNNRENQDEMTKTNNTSIERKILLLYQEGKSEQDIARELSIGVGEVMLILSLFRHRTDHS